MKTKLQSDAQFVSRVVKKYKASECCFYRSLSKQPKIWPHSYAELHSGTVHLWIVAVIPSIEKGM